MGVIEAASPKSVLIADRGRSLVPPEQTVLERKAVGIVPTPTAESVIEAMRRENPRLLVVGPDLPDASVAELCRRIRSDEQLKHISILLVASPVERDRAEEIRRAGANEILYRPLEAAEFDRKVGALLSVPVRKNFRALVQIRVDQRRDGFFLLGHTKNLSLSGALLETDHALEVGSALAVRFFLPGSSREIVASAEVVRERPSPIGLRLFGIRFAGLTEEDKISIGEFVSRRSVAEAARDRKRDGDDGDSGKVK